MRDLVEKILLEFIDLFKKTHNPKDILQYLEVAFNKILIKYSFYG